MRRSIRFAPQTLASFALLAGSTLTFGVGCGASTTSFVKSDAALGRIIVYRNGVAYYEREATVENDSLRLVAPNDKVDDFLKSLTVVDSATGKPAPVSYPHGGGSTIDLKVHLPGHGPHKVKLSYVTEAPAWKPTYRILVGSDGKLELQAWAVVDNTSGEDWEQVKLGVGSSSAMAFRFDLRGFRFVQRQQLQGEQLFAVAPPSGGSVYGGADERNMGMVAELSDDALVATTASRPRDLERAEAKMAPREAPRSPSPKSQADSAPSKPRATTGAGRGAGMASGGYSGGAAYGAAAAPAMPPPPPAQAAAQGQLAGLANQLRQNQNVLVIEGFAKEGDGDKQSASLDRANKVREEIVRQGIDPNRVVAVGKGDMPGKSGGVRFVQQGPVAANGVKGKNQQQATGGEAAQPGQAANSGPGEPVGTAHFESETSMSVAKGSSAMVSMYQGKTEGSVVYLYDPESERGNGDFAFKAVRFKNPTDSQLESGPVTVYGSGRFIGEGIGESIPARSIAFVPFALDRQVLVEKKIDHKDTISKILTAQRGVFSTETKHTRKTALVLHNRAEEKALVYVRHTVPQGYVLDEKLAKAERVGQGYVFPIEVPAHAKIELVIEETTPVTQATDIRTREGLEMIKAFISADLAQGPLKEAVQTIVREHLELANIEQRKSTAREQLAEYRNRMDELHAQIVTLKVVKSAGPMMQSLEKKLTEVSDKVSKMTVQIVDLEEQAMVARIKLQDSISELSMDDGKKKDEKKDEKKKDEKAAPGKKA
jgi:hypothetical protein